MKIVTARQAAEAIKDGSVFTIGGFCGFVAPEELLIGIRERYDETGSPKDLTMLKGVSVGDYAERGASRISVPGLVTKIICSHLGLEPATMKLVADGDAELTMLPLGTIVEFETAAASGMKDIITEVGIGTFVDPDVDPDAMADKITLNGTDYLHYAAMPIDVALIRMTTADETGNLTCEKEAMVADQFEAEAPDGVGGRRHGHGAQHVRAAGLVLPMLFFCQGLQCPCIVFLYLVEFMQSVKTGRYPLQLPFVLLKVLLCAFPYGNDKHKNKAYIPQDEYDKKCLCKFIRKRID